MKKFTVQFQEIRTYSIIVEAEDEDEAIEKAEDISGEVGAKHLTTSYDGYEVIPTA